MNKKGKGFGLVEIVTVISILAILVAIATPSFGTLVQNNTLTESANKFLSSMALARSEASTRNINVVMCQLNNLGNGCNNDGRWENGWTVWADTNGNGVLDGNETITSESALPANFTLRAGNNQFTNSITYNSLGNATGDGGNGAEIFRLCEPTANITISRSINLNAVGRAFVNRNPGTTACP